jgi:hypothetical protein
MSLLHFLRSSPWLARLALLWFALTLGVAVASPLVHPQSELVICSGVGMQKVVLNDDGTTTTSGVSGMSCPLCLVGGAPPLTATLTVKYAESLGHVLHSTPASHIDGLTVAPPPGRGPPISL